MNILPRTKYSQSRKSSTHDQWRIQDFCEGDAAGVWGAPPEGSRAESLVRGSGAKPPAPRKAEHFVIRQQFNLKFGG